MLLTLLGLVILAFAFWYDRTTRAGAGRDRDAPIELQLSYVQSRQFTRKLYRGGFAAAGVGAGLLATQGLVRLFWRRIPNV